MTAVVAAAAALKTPAPIVAEPLASHAILSVDLCRSMGRRRRSGWTHRMTILRRAPATAYPWSLQGRELLLSLPSRRHCPDGKARTAEERRANMLSRMPNAAGASTAPHILADWSVNRPFPERPAQWEAPRTALQRRLPRPPPSAAALKGSRAPGHSSNLCCRPRFKRLVGCYNIVVQPPLR